MDDRVSEPGPNDNISLSEGWDASGEVIFLPVSTSQSQNSADNMLGNLGLSQSIIPDTNTLSAGYALVQAGGYQLCFIQVPEIGSTDSLLAVNLRNALLDPSISAAADLWVPLMQIEEKQLPLDASRALIFEALASTGWSSKAGVHITVAFPPGLLVDKSRFGNIRLEPALDAALAFAATLSLDYKSDGSLSTTLLFLALAVSQGLAAPYALRKNHVAAMFSGAVQSMAETRLSEAWNEYFPRGRDRIQALERLWPIRPTANVVQIVRYAAKPVVGSNVGLVTIGDFLRTLIAYPQGRHHLCMERMQIPEKTLLSEFEKAIAGEIGTNLLNDVPATIDSDLLGYSRYATAIARFLTNRKTTAPISISIQAPWGVGKSSLMRQIREKLDPFPRGASDSDQRLTIADALDFLGRKRDVSTRDVAEGEHWTVWFNAWKYDSSEQVWAGLVDAIVSEVSARLPFCERELFLLKLQLARIDDGVVRRKIYDRIISLWWARARKWIVTGTAGIASWLSLHHAVSALADDQSWFTAATFLPVALGGAGLTIYSYLSYKSAAEKTRSEPAAFSLAEYIQVPDYNRSLGQIHHIHHDLTKVLSLTPRDNKGKPLPLVVFVDDLDRCSPMKIADVVEGVSTFLADSDYHCFFVIGMDPQIIAAALEEAHQKVRGHLPTSERSVPLGWRFMDKIIQLPFTIPPTRKAGWKDFLSWLTDPEPSAPILQDRQSTAPVAPTRPVEAGDSKDPARAIALTQGTDSLSSQNENAPQAYTSEPRKESPTEAIISRFLESRDVGEVIGLAARDLSSNPREMKRLANVARLYLGLRNTRQDQEPHWTPPAITCYARWIVLTLKWPEVMRWLLWGADEGSWLAEEISTELVERRIRLLEEKACATDAAGNWPDMVKVSLGLKFENSTDWTLDRRLFDFFAAESEFPSNERLSAAVALEFW